MIVFYIEKHPSGQWWGDVYRADGAAYVTSIGPKGSAEDVRLAAALICPDAAEVDEKPVP